MSLGTPRGAEWALLDAMADSAWLKDIAGRYVAVNAAYAVLLQRSKDAIVGSSDEELLSAELALGSQGRDAQVVATGLPIAADVALAGPDGSPRWLETIVTPVRDADGAIVGTSGVARDVTAQRATDRALRASETRMRTIFEESPLGIGLADSRGFIVDTNAAYQRMVGYSADELRQMRFSELSSPADASENVALFQDLALGRTHSYAVEKTYLHKSGQSLRVRLTSAAIRDTQDQLLYSVGMVEDVTKMRLVEASLRDREEVFRALTEQTSELNAILDADGTICYASPSIERVLGYSSDELVGTSPLELIHPDDAGAMRRVLVEVASNGAGSATALMRFEHADGGHRVLEASFTNLLQHHAVRGIVVSARDVTERVRAADDIRFQADLLDAVEQAVIAVDEADRVTAWNRHAERLYGWTRAEALGRPIDTLIRAELAGEHAPSTVIPCGESATRERVIRRRDGTMFVVAVTASPIHAPNGVRRGRVGVSCDITLQRSLEEQLRQAQKMETVGRLAGGVAHDFNNLLTVVIAHAEFLRRGGPTASRWREDIDGITEAAVRASTLTRQLLAFGRKQVLLSRALSFNEVIEGMRPVLGMSLREDIRIEMSLAPALPPIHADPGQLEQVILNVAANARDAMPRGGTLTLTTFVARPPNEDKSHSVSDDPIARYVALSIADTGIGMDPATASKMFEPFYTTKGAGRGSGLGLSTVYGIVKQSGGNIDVDTRLGGGTTITIYLPVAHEHAAPDTANDAGEPVDDGDAAEVVLVVEDDPAVRRLTSRILTQAGYVVVEAESGEDALSRMASTTTPFSLVLTDVVMPGMSGRELGIELLRTQPNAAILYMSGYTGDEVFERGLLPSGTSFIPKPFTSGALLVAVRDRLGHATVP
ncbi:MAG: PAS domain S-box protein [bacterium]